MIDAVAKTFIDWCSSTGNNMALMRRSALSVSGNLYLCTYFCLNYWVDKEKVQIPSKGKVDTLSITDPDKEMRLLARPNTLIIPVEVVYRLVWEQSFEEEYAKPPSFVGDPIKPEQMVVSKDETNLRRRSMTGERLLDYLVVKETVLRSGISLSELAPYRVDPRLNTGAQFGSVWAMRENWPKGFNGFFKPVWDEEREKEQKRKKEEPVKVDGNFKDGFTALFSEFKGGELVMGKMPDQKEEKPGIERPWRPGRRKIDL